MKRGDFIIKIVGAVVISILMLSSLTITSSTITPFEKEPSIIIENEVIVDIPNTTEQQESTWPMFRNNLNHTSYTPYTGPANPTLAWTFTANDGFVSSPAISPDGTIYVGAGWNFSGTNDSCLYAINPNGSIKWCYETNHSIFSSPALGPDGTIYVGSLDRHLYAIEDMGTYGELKWKTHLGFWVYSSPAIGPDGSIYVGSINFNIYALHSNGTIKWWYPTGWCVFSSPAIALDGTIYIGSKDHNLYALQDNTTNAELEWKFATGSFYDGHLVDSSPAIGHDGTIYVGTDQYGAAGQTPIPVNTSFWAINTDGTLKWSFDTEDGVESSPAIGPDGTIYFGSYDGYLYAVTDNDNEGVLKWKFLTNGSVDGSPTVDGDGIIYFGSRDSNLYALYPNGTVKWTFTANDGFESSPTIDGNGYLYIGSFDGNLYALGTGAPDVGVHSADIPQKILTNSIYYPSTTVRNYRSSNQSFNVNYLIKEQDTIVYNETISVNLTGESSEQLFFPSWLVGSTSGIIYTVSATTILPSDDNVENNQITGQMETSDIQFIRGDANGDSDITMIDAIRILQNLYVPGSPEILCLDSADVDDSGEIAMSDAIYLLKHIYVPSSPSPPLPFPECGLDPTDDQLDCGYHPCMSSIVTIESIGEFEYYPLEIETLRTDIFANGHFSVFDILVYLNNTGAINLVYHFDESMNTYVIDTINDLENWWYQAYYDGGWPEGNSFRMDHFPYKDKITIRLYQILSEPMESLYNSFREAVTRREQNNGSIIIPTVKIHSLTFDEQYHDIEVTPHNIRSDVFQPGVITSLDTIISMADQGILTYEIKWYDSVGTADIVRSYYLSTLNGDESHGKCGYVYETEGGHIHIPVDTRVINSPVLEEWFYICL